MKHHGTNVTGYPPAKRPRTETTEGERRVSAAYLAERQREESRHSPRDDGSAYLFARADAERRIYATVEPIAEDDLIGALIDAAHRGREHGVAEKALNLLEQYRPEIKTVAMLRRTLADLEEAETLLHVPEIGPASVALLRVLVSRVR